MPRHNQPRGDTRGAPAALAAGARNAYAWTRFWYASGDEIPVESGGFLVDPLGDYGHLLNPKAQQLEALDDVGCLVLLGEPGTGKSTELRNLALRNAVGDVDALEGPLVVSANLGDYDSIPDLIQDVIRTPNIPGALCDGRQVTLLLDSFDEAMLTIRPLASRLATEFGRLPEADRSARLRVRLACRSVEFPEVLRTALAELWHGEAFRAVELAPLRWQDVETAARARLGGAEAAARFLDRVAEREAAPFAARPATLEFLLRSYAEHGDFPPTRAGLYSAGCRSLVQEANDSRRASGRAGALDPDQRLAVASRLAAATVFGNRAAVWTGIERGDVPSTDTTIATLVGSERHSGPDGQCEREISVTVEPLRETLGTGLFTSRGRAERVGWAHQSYAEFLAAWWVERHALSIEQVTGLIVDSGDLEGHLVPQLHGVAEWLAGMRPDVYRLVAERDPGVLLRADTYLVPYGDRAVLVDALLRATEANTVRWREFLEHLPYERLEHPELAVQLVPVIADAERPEHVRSFAIEIAEGCRLAAAIDSCAVVALDPAAPVRLRAEAAGFVGQVGDLPTRERLIRLATIALPEDVDDDIKGTVLRGTWQSLGPDALFSALTRARKPNRYGSYEGFLSELAESLTPEYLAAGLEWIERLGHVSGGGASRLEDRIVIDAVAHCHDPEIRARLVRVVRHRLARYEPLLNGDAVPRLRDALEANEGARHALVRDLVEKEPHLALALSSTSGDVLQNQEAATSTVQSGDGREAARVETITPQAERHASRVAFEVAGGLGHGGVDFIKPTDLPWVVEMWHAAPARSPISAAWREVAQLVFDYRNEMHVEYVYDRRGETALDEAFGVWFRPMALDGPEARQFHQRERESEQRRAQRDATLAREAAATPLPSEARVRELLFRADALERWRAWPAIAWELGRSQTDSHAGPSRDDLSETTLWAELSPATRDVARQVAAEFLRHQRWRGGATDQPVRWDAVAGPAYQAILLVADDPAALTLVTWRRWLPVLCSIRVHTNDDGERTSHYALLRRAQSVSPRAFARAVGRLLDNAVLLEHEGRRPELTIDAIVSALGKPAAPHDDHEWAGVTGEPGAAREFIVKEVLLRCEDANTPGSILGDFLAPLLAHDVPAARALARTLLTRVPARGPRRERALAAATALFTHAPDAGWTEVWSAMRRSDAFARELVQRLAVDREHPVRALRQRLSEDQVADLYTWLARTYPPQDDPWHTQVFSPGWRDNVIHWRDGLLTALESWGTAGALDALAKIADAIPERPYLGQTLLRARAAFRSALWHAPAVADLLALADRRERRLIRGAGELLAAVLQSLERYGEGLRGELPAVPTLWDRVSDTEFRPKDEGHLADDIIRHLRRDLAGSGVVVGCEIVVDRGIKGVSAGRRTDIIVTAVSLANRMEGTGLNPVSVVVEVKGSWHHDVRTAMQTQLAEGYLAEEQSYRHGVYLVGWYTCAAWREGPDKRSSARLGTLEGLRSELEQQARSLSGSVRVLRALVLDASLPSADTASRMAGKGSRVGKRAPRADSDARRRAR